MTNVTAPGLEALHRIIPNTLALHPETKFDVFREYKAATETVELTIYYREPGRRKMRIDAELKYEDPAVEAMPKDVRIVGWKDALRGES